MLRFKRFSSFDIVNERTNLMTQGMLGQRTEQLGVSDRGVIKVRRIVLEAIETAIRGRLPTGMAAKHRGERVIKLDSFVGVRPKVAVS